MSKIYIQNNTIYVEKEVKKLFGVKHKIDVVKIDEISWVERVEEKNILTAININSEKKFISIYREEVENLENLYDSILNSRTETNQFEVVRVNPDTGDVVKII